MLSWAVSLLAQSPEVEDKAFEEVDRVLGSDPNVIVDDKMINELKYITQIMKESMRLYPPAPGVTKVAAEDDVLGPYQVKKGQRLLLSYVALHRNEQYWKDPLRFDPDRFSPENVAKQHPYAFTPFSMATRSCLGQAFSLTEAKIFLAKILQRFHIRLEPDADLSIVEKLTLRPSKLHISLHKRYLFILLLTWFRQHHFYQGINSSLKNSVPSKPAESKLDLNTLAMMPASPVRTDVPVVILYGTATQTTFEYAQMFAKLTGKMGLKVSGVFPLDNYADVKYWEGLKGAYVIIFTCTINGCPPDTAVEFDKWLKKTLSSKTTPLSGIHFSVFGFGSSDYPNYQTFPRKVDGALETLGAERVHERGEADTKQHMEDSYREWTAKLMETLRIELGLADDASIKATQEVPPSCYEVMDIILVF